MINIILLGEKIRRYRKELGITQTELATKLNISFQAVSNWERGTAPPDLDNIVKLADLFNVTIDGLLNTNQCTRSLYLGIDGGATKTEFVVFSDDGCIYKKFKLSSSNPNDIGVDGCVSILSQGIDACINEFPDLTKIFAGVSGLGAGNNKKEVSTLLSIKYPNLNIKLATDAINVFSSADEPCSTAMICGTGSVVFARHNNTLTRVGGWGFHFDGAGSAYDIGRDAVSACLSYEDGLSEYTKIYPLLCSAIDSRANTVWESIDVLYKKGKAYIASLTPIVFKAAAAGDEIANNILKRNIDRLGKLLNKATSISGNRNVIACGGLFENYGDVLIKMLQEINPEFIFIVPDLPPVYGACKECLFRFNVVPSDDFHKNFSNDYLRSL